MRTCSQKSARRAGGRAAYGIALGRQKDPFACRTWDQVTEKFNELNGTHLTRARIQQIGQAAMAKLLERSSELRAFAGGR